MFSRALLVLLTGFWLVMNLLLWRAEFGGSDPGAVAIPAEVVWQKILTAPDSSSLTVYHHGNKVGFCHWMTSVGEDLSRLREDDALPEGMVGRVNGYRIQMEGNFALPDVPGRIRFDCSLKLRTNQVWQELSARLNVRPAVFEVHSVAAERTVHLKGEDDGARFEHVFKFSELQDPQSLLRTMAGPFTRELLGGLELPDRAQTSDALSLGLKWEARNDSVRVGHALVRAYRVQVHLFDRYKAVVFVSRVGEILRVELPDDLLLVNDQLANF